jgi:Putative peptidoglycan binding domain
VNRERDRDDWFEGTEPDGSPAPDRAGNDDADEDWLLDDDLPPPRPWLEGIDRGVLVIAAVGIGFLIAVLAAAGVFSGSPTTSVPTVTTPAITTPTTQPTTTPQAQPLPAPNATLKPGDTGAQVKVLQRALASLGFLTGKIDGQYGPATEAAVKRFQRSSRLTADGIVGPTTQAALAIALRGR